MDKLATKESELMAAARAGETSRCLELIASNANINVVDAFGWTPLILSISYKKLDTAMVLLETKADVTMKDRYSGNICLHYAAWKGQLALCRTMVEQYGADVHATNTNGDTPLIFAAYYGRADVCVYLLNADARVDAETNEGDTALQVAVQYNNTKTIAAIRAWIKDRDAAAAFTQGTKHAYDTYQSDSWTMNHFFDKHLISEITSFVTPTPTVKVQ